MTVKIPWKTQKYVQSLSPKFLCLSPAEDIFCEKFHHKSLISKLQSEVASMFFTKVFADIDFAKISGKNSNFNNQIKEFLRFKLKSKKDSFLFAW